MEQRECLGSVLPLFVNSVDVVVNSGWMHMRRIDTWSDTLFTTTSTLFTNSGRTEPRNSRCSMHVTQSDSVLHRHVVRRRIV
jgi:hypothetical protein